MRLIAPLACLLLAVLFVTPNWSAQAQFSAPCGIVDALDYPIDIGDTLEQGYDDFGVYRPRFGGNHTAVDIGFDRWGDPIRAAARGRVTLASVDEWDTEKGVVILEHVFPDGSIAYTLYGHVEQGDGGMLPMVGTCVERGDVVALEGWPSRGKPHLHYEIRSMWPDDGGPGYVAGNPLDDGWYHPLEFTEMWRARLQPGFLSVQTFRTTPTLPPALLDDGTAALTLSDQLIATQDGVERWRISLGEIATGLTGLSGGRIAALARGGQAFTLQSGRFLGAWQVSALEVSPAVAHASTGDEALVFATEAGGLAAFTVAGAPLWTIPALAGEAAAPRVVSLSASGNEIALVIRATDGPLMRLVRDGALVTDLPLADPAVVTPLPEGGWLVMNGTQIERLNEGQPTLFAELERTPGRGSQLSIGQSGTIYAFTAGTAPMLTAYEPDGTPRWQTTVPAARTGLAPLVTVGGGCLVYTLDANGALRAYRTADGELAGERLLYPGGNQSGNPRARLLTADAHDVLTVGAGFLSVIRFDGLLIGGGAAECAA